MDSQQELQNWLDHVRTYRIPIANQLITQIDFFGEILEIGAGTAWFSLWLSNQKPIKRIVALEKNPDRIEVSKRFFAEELSSDSSKIEYLQADFESIPNKIGSFDFIVCEAALHHTDNLPNLLTNLHSKLKPGGRLIAIREPVLPKLPLLTLFRKLTFGRAQKARGDIENIYTKKQWENFLKAAGFRVEIIPMFISSTVKERFLSKISFLNFIIYNRSAIIAARI